MSVEHGVILLRIFCLCTTVVVGPQSSNSDMILREGNHEITGAVTLRSLVVHPGANITFIGDSARIFVNHRSLKLNGKREKPIHLFSKDFIPEKGNRKYTWRYVDNGYQSKDI